MNLLRFAVALLVAALLLAPTSGTALAVQPANDFFLNATVVSIDFSESLDTTEATTDSDDTQLNVFCGAPATDASVWYAVTVSADSTIIVDVSQSSYSAGVMVGMRTQGNLSLVACAPSNVSFFAIANVIYYVAAFDDQYDGGANGGLLNISLREAVPPTLELTVNRMGQVDVRTGIATISGTYTCTNGEYLSGNTDGRQTVGRFAISGYGYFSNFGVCDGAPHPWSTILAPTNGKFAGGKLMTTTWASVCGYFCAYAYVQQEVQLRGASASGAAGSTSAGEESAGGAVDAPQLFLPAITDE